LLFFIVAVDLKKRPSSKKQNKTKQNHSH